jgi:hypothetical protein
MCSGKNSDVLQIWSLLTNIQGGEWDRYLNGKGRVD